MKTELPDLNRKVTRHILVKCKANRGGKHLVPVSIQEIRPTPDDPVMDYEHIGPSSEYFGEYRDQLEKRGDLVTVADGSDRITRTPHLGKSLTRGRNGFVFIRFTVSVHEWARFTKRTEDPKLAWLENQCRAAGLRVVRHGASWHAPITYVHRDDYVAAWDILGPVDEVRDDHPRFTS